MLSIVVENTLVCFLSQLLPCGQLRTRHLVCNLGDELVAEKVYVWRCRYSTCSLRPLAPVLVISPSGPRWLPAVRIGTQIQIHLLLP